MHFVTEKQVLAAATEAKKMHSRTGSVLVQQGIITLDKLKYALKAQLAMDVVSDEQVSSLDKKTISILPEDFIKMYKTVPISVEENSLTVGMVNPNDKAAISNIILFTNMNPNVLILTEYEYRMIIKNFFKY